MWVIVLEALAALAVLVFIVWWTMFSGRPRGERKRPDGPAPPDAAPEELGSGKPQDDRSAD